MMFEEMKQQIIESVKEKFHVMDYYHYAMKSILDIAHWTYVNFEVLKNDKYIIDFDLTYCSDYQDAFVVYDKDGEYLEQQTEELNRLIPIQDVEELFYEYYNEMEECLI